MPGILLQGADGEKTLERLPGLEVLHRGQLSHQAPRRLPQTRRI